MRNDVTYAVETQALINNGVDTVKPVTNQETTSDSHHNRPNHALYDVIVAHTKEENVSYDHTIINQACRLLACIINNVVYTKQVPTPNMVGSNAMLTVIDDATSGGRSVLLFLSCEDGTKCCIKHADQAPSTDIHRFNVVQYRGEGSMTIESFLMVYMLLLGGASSQKYHNPNVLNTLCDRVTGMVHEITQGLGDINRVLWWLKHVTRITEQPTSKQKTEIRRQFLPVGTTCFFYNGSDPCTHQSRHFRRYCFEHRNVLVVNDFDCAFTQRELSQFTRSTAIDKRVFEACVKAIEKPPKTILVSRPEIVTEIKIEHQPSRLFENAPALKKVLASASVASNATVNPALVLAVRRFLLHIASVNDTEYISRATRTSRAPLDAVIKRCIRATVAPDSCKRYGINPCAN